VSWAKTPQVDARHPERPKSLGCANHAQQTKQGKSENLTLLQKQGLAVPGPYNHKIFRNKSRHEVRELRLETLND
jgi:hypothetical protein